MFVLQLFACSQLLLSQTPLEPPKPKDCLSKTPLQLKHLMTQQSRESHAIQLFRVELCHFPIQAALTLIAARPERFQASLLTRKTFSPVIRAPSLRRLLWTVFMTPSVAFWFTSHTPQQSGVTTTIIRFQLWW